MLIYLLRGSSCGILCPHRGTWDEQQQRHTKSQTRVAATTAWSLWLCLEVYSQWADEKHVDLWTKNWNESYGFCVIYTMSLCSYCSNMLMSGLILTCRQARTCLEIWNPCWKIWYPVLEESSKHRSKTGSYRSFW